MLKKESLIWSISGTEWIKTLIREKKITFVSVAGQTRWTRSQNTMVLQANSGLFYHGVFYENIQKLPSYIRFVDALKSNPDISRQLGKLVSSPLGGSMLLARNIAIGLLPSANFFNNTETYDFEKLFKEHVLSLLQKEVFHFTVAPIFGLHIQKTIILDKSTLIRRMTDDELATALSTGMSAPPNMMSGTFFIPNEGNLACLEIKLRLPKYIPGENNDNDDEKGKLAQKVFEENAERLEKLRQVFHLMNIPIDYSGTYSFTVGTGFGGIQYSLMQAIRWIPDKQVFTDDKKLKEMWSALNDKRFDSSRSLSMSLRRLGFSAQRYRIEDKILDLLIAAESFYMADGDNERGDIGYRLRLRAAFWYEGIKEKKEILSIFRDAYYIRNDIAHGRKLEQVIKVNNSKRTIIVADLIKEIEEILILAINKGIKKWGEKKSKDFIDWESIILQKKDGKY